MPASVRRDDHSRQMQEAALLLGKRSNWQLTAAAESGKRSALAIDRLSTGSMIECATNPEGFVGGACLDCQGALSRSRTHFGWRKDLGNFMFQSQTFQTCGSQQNGVELSFFQLAQPRIDVTAHRFDQQIGSKDAKLGRPPARTCPDAASLDEFRQLFADKCIAWILT